MKKFSDKYGYIFRFSKLKEAFNYELAQWFRIEGCDFSPTRNLVREANIIPGANEDHNPLNYKETFCNQMIELMASYIQTQKIRIADCTPEDISFERFCLIADMAGFKIVYEA